MLVRYTQLKVLAVSVLPSVPLLLARSLATRAFPCVLSRRGVARLPAARGLGAISF